MNTFREIFARSKYLWILFFFSYVFMTLLTIDEKVFLPLLFGIVGWLIDEMIRKRRRNKAVRNSGNIPTRDEISQNRRILPLSVIRYIIIVFVLEILYILLISLGNNYVSSLTQTWINLTTVLVNGVADVFPLIDEVTNRLAALSVSERIPITRNVYGILWLATIVAFFVLLANLRKVRAFTRAKIYNSDGSRNEVGFDMVPLHICLGIWGALFLGYRLYYGGFLMGSGDPISYYFSLFALAFRFSLLILFVFLLISILVSVDWTQNQS